MSSANARFSVSSVIALPPYFTTIVLPWYSFSHGSAAASVPALAVALFQAGSTSAFCVSAGVVIDSRLFVSCCRRSSRARRRA
jgi:hypothetical protein